MKELVQVQIFTYTDRYFRIGESLQVEDRVEILLLLIKNLDVFAWNPYESSQGGPDFYYTSVECTGHET